MNFKLSERLLTILLTLLVVCSCGDNNQKKTEEYNWEGNNIEEQHIPDSMVRVTVDSFDSDSLYVTIKSTKEKKSFCYYSAQNGNSIIGTIQQGDEYSILANTRNNEIKSAFNITQMMGQWFFDTQHSKGMIFDAKGALSSINTDEISFRRWQFLNGKLLIYYVYTQQEAEKQNQFEVDTVEVQKLTTDEFNFQFRNKQYNCIRQKDALKFKVVNE